MFHAPIVSTMIVSSGVQGPNPMDFRSVMEKIRRKTASFFFLSLPRACYSSLVFPELIVMSERLICFNIKKEEGEISAIDATRTKKIYVQYSAPAREKVSF